MEVDTEYFLSLIEALGIGLLIGIERERHAHRYGEKTSAGVRTFALASLVGALSLLAGGVTLLAVAVVIVGAVRIVSVVLRGDPAAGLATSLALVAVVLLGALAVETATMA
ncbi:MAG: MgtC/SapB family protein, partial [Gammaproteobacteria bacterium]